MGKHQALLGTDPKTGKFWTKIAEPYPWTMCLDIAKGIIKHYVAKTADVPQSSDFHIIRSFGKVVIVRDKRRKGQGRIDSFTAPPPAR